jgi:dTDP-4-dehydrorhamnose reductase
MSVAEGDERSPGTSVRGQRIAITGAGGQLGRYLVQAIADAGAQPIGLGHHEGPGVDHVVDITDRDATARAIAAARPDVVIHGAAMTDVDGCETDPERADRINHLGTRHVAEAAAAAGAHLVAVSTDFVFAGDDPPYGEDDPTNPISVYGSSKRDGELAVLEVSDRFAIARTAWVYGGAGKHFPRSILNLLAARPTIDVVNDELGNPTFAGDLAVALVQLAGLRAAGIHHLTNEGVASRFELARAVASLAGEDPERVRPTTAAEFLKSYPLPAKRPANSALANTRAAASAVRLRPWQDALADYIPRLATELKAQHA